MAYSCIHGPRTINRSCGNFWITYTLQSTLHVSVTHGIILLLIDQRIHSVSAHLYTLLIKQNNR